MSQDHRRGANGARECKRAREQTRRQVHVVVVQVKSGKQATGSFPTFDLTHPSIGLGKQYGACIRKPERARQKHAKIEDNRPNRNEDRKEERKIRRGSYIVKSVSAAAIVAEQ